MVSGKGGSVLYRVVLEGLGNEAETMEAFAIKFSLLTNTPISKIKYLLRSIPVTLWTGDVRTGAESLLSVIEEAGGRAVIEEVDPKRAEDIEIPVDRSQEDAAELVKEKAGGPCPKCGFPNSGDEEYCRFCTTPLTDSVKRRVADLAGAGKNKHWIPVKRLLVYVIVLLGVIIWDLICG